MEVLNGKMNKMDDEHLPPGFRFHPMDEELVTFYLTKKVVDSSFSCRAITEVDLNKCEPWDLPAKATMGEKEWYFFSLRDRKYPTGLRTNRATQAGYWKATGKDREIFKGRTNTLVGMKKTLVFYKGRAPKGEKTNWVMHEYRLEGKFSYSNLRTAKDEWVVSRIFQKSSGAKKGQLGHSRSSNYLNDMDSPALPPLLESPYVPPNGLNNNEGGSSDSAGSAMDQQHVTCFSTPPTDSHHKLYNNNNSSNNQRGMRQTHGSIPGEIDLSFLQNIMLGDQTYMNANPQALSGLRQTHDLQVNVGQQMSGAQHLPSFSMAPVSNFPHLFPHSSFPSTSIWRALFDQYSGGVGSNEMIGGLKQCKMEPPSSSFCDNKDMKLQQVQSPWEPSAAMQPKFVPISQPMVTMSQETGLTTEMNNTEISSVVSSQMNNNNQHYSDEGLECLWPLT